MASGGDILGTGVSALLAYQRALATVGHNIANVNTEGYTRQRVELDARPPQAYGNGFVGKGVEVTSVRRLHSAFLTDQVRQAGSTLAYLDNLNGLAREVDNLLADPQAGLAPALEDFFQAVDDVADAPASGATRQALLSQGASLATRFRYLDGRLAEMQEATNTQMEVLVGEINRLADSLAAVNRDIVRQQGAAGGQPANDLLDQRDRLVNQLAERVGLTLFQQDDGSVNVFIGNGQALVVGGTARRLETVANAFDAEQKEIAFAPPNTSGPISDFLSGGRLGGLLAFRGQVLAPARNALGRVALGLVYGFNDQHRLGQDLEGNLGAAFFDVPAPEAFGRSNNTTATNIDVSIADVTRLTTADYELRFDGTSSWTLTNLATGKTVTMSGSGTDADPFVADGLSISVQALGASNGDSYAFLIRPTRPAAGDMGVALARPEQVAAAAPIRTTARLTNTGSGAISAGSVNGPPPPDANLRQTVTITFDDPPTTFDVSGTGTGNPTDVGFTAGADISYNGWTVRITGSPQAGDVFVIEANAGGVGDNRNALLLGALQDARALANGTVSYQEAYAQLVAEVGSTTRETGIDRDAQQALYDLAVQSRDSVSAVNLDEEAAALLRFQQAYQAAARVISAADFMFQELIQAVRR